MSIFDLKNLNEIDSIEDVLTQLKTLRHRLHAMSASTISQSINSYIQPLVEVEELFNQIGIDLSLSDSVEDELVDLDDEDKYQFNLEIQRMKDRVNNEIENIFKDIDSHFVISCGWSTNLCPSGAARDNRTLKLGY